MVDNYSLRNQDLSTLYSRHVASVCTRHDHTLENSGASHVIIFSGNPKFAFLDDMPYPFKPNPHFLSWDDMPYPFKPNPHFLSWAPLVDLPLSYIVYTPGDKPLLIYHQPHDYWHVVPGTPDGFWAEQFEVRIVSSTDDVAQHLPRDREKCILIGEIRSAPAQGSRKVHSDRRDRR